MTPLKYIHSLLLGKCVPVHPSPTHHINSRLSIHHQPSIRPLLMVLTVFHHHPGNGVEKTGATTTSHLALRLYQMLLLLLVLGDQSRCPVHPKTNEAIHQVNPTLIHAETKSDMSPPLWMLPQN
jgi:hypothetical protein